MRKFQRLLLFCGLLAIGTSHLACKEVDVSCSDHDALCDGLRVVLAYQSVTPIIVLGDSLGQVHVSYDGIFWRSVAVDSGNRIADITYANGFFWVVSARTAGNAAVFYSADGLTWQSTSNGLVAPAVGLYGIAFGNGRYAAVGPGAVAYYSSDGINWSVTNDTDLALLDFACCANQLEFRSGFFIAGDQNGGQVTYSADGIDWVIGPNSGSVPNQFSSIGAQIFWADVGNLLTIASIKLTTATTITGLTGIRATGSNNFNFGAAVGDTGAIHTTTDGITWSGNLRPGGTVNLTTVTVQEPRLMVAAGASGGYYLSRSGGASWEGPYTITGAGNIESSAARPGYPF